jgi:hypothetical protein
MIKNVKHGGFDIVNLKTWTWRKRLSWKLKLSLYHSRSHMHTSKRLLCATMYFYIHSKFDRIIMCYRNFVRIYASFNTMIMLEWFCDTYCDINMQVIEGVFINLQFSGKEIRQRFIYVQDHGRYVTITVILHKLHSKTIDFSFCKIMMDHRDSNVFTVIVKMHFKKYVKLWNCFGF